MANSGAKKSGVSTPVTDFLTDQEVAYAIHRYEQADDTQGYGLSAARSLDVAPERVFKTMLANIDGKPMNAVVPVACDLDLKALASTVGAQEAEIVDYDDIKKVTGYSADGMSPLAQKNYLPTIVDVSALDFATIYLSAGKPGLDIEMSPEDLVRLTQARTAPLGQR